MSFTGFPRINLLHLLASASWRFWSNKLLMTVRSQPAQYHRHAHIPSPSNSTSTYILLMHTSHHPAIPLLPIYSTEMHTYCHQKTWTRMFIEALFVIAQIRNYPMTINSQKGKQVIVYSLHRILYSKENEWLLTTWMNLKNIILSERN